MQRTEISLERVRTLGSVVLTFRTIIPAVRLHRQYHTIGALG
jgi:hypothetical protein